jgi:hypothetical protein
LLIYEFLDTDWETILVAHAHLFFFFPVLGVLALFAFYLPSVVFTHFYWTHVRWGKLRFLFGALVLALLSVGVTVWLNQPPRGIWEISPYALASDRGDQGRGPILQSLQELRTEAHNRMGLSKFARSCAVDRYLEPPEDMAKVRYCFPARTQLKGAECCAVQKRFGETVTDLYRSPSGRSLSALYDVFFMPLKVFFVLVVVAIAILLAIWRDRIDQHYRELVPRLERGIIIGAAAMLFWPAMDYGYQQTTNVLFGRMSDGPQFRLSLVLVPWALLLLFYFLRRLGKQGEMIGQISGVVVAAVAVLRYEQLNDTVGRLFGIGAETSVLMGLVALAVVALMLLLWFRYRGKGPAYPTADA